MNEEFLHYLWKYGLYRSSGLKLSTGDSIRVIKPGHHNENAGPDFLNAMVQIMDTLWAGNIEIHLKASDWHRHKHGLDPAYDNVLIQVVADNDLPVYRRNGEIIPCLVVPFNKKYLANYQELEKGFKNRNTCRGISSFPEEEFEMFVTALFCERMMLQEGRILNLLDEKKGDWRACFYHFILRSFGSPLNSSCFEILTEHVPWKVLYAQRENFLSLEALLYGAGGFLDDAPQQDEYVARLKKEFEFLKRKYRLTAMDVSNWKFLRMRPTGFPTLQIAQLAAFFKKCPDFYSHFLDVKEFEEMNQAFQVSPSPYWKTHYHFGKSSKKQHAGFSISLKNKILINGILPLLFTYFGYHGNYEKRRKLMSWFEKIPAEQNKIIRQWENLGISVHNALYSQALIHLFNQYCNQKKCLNCRIGNFMIKNSK